jgi:lipoprotein-anchoring transpeptidase ErfK/SrfK
VFTPSVPFSQATKVTVRVPSGTSGVHSASGGLLTRPVTRQFTTGTYSQGSLAVMLAQQGYLPMTWTPTSESVQGADPAAQTLAGMAYAPPAGTYTWQAGYPSQLQAQWSPDQANPLLKGAVMAFQSQHGMMPDGNLTPKVWDAIFTAQQKGQHNTAGYTYALASKAYPESLTIWHDGKVVQRSPDNTGAANAPTADGTFPVYERLRNQVMMGTNPDGSHYADPVQFVAYFNGGDAVHYFPRASFGTPQSLGCVELGLSDAAHAWPLLTYGSLVTVTG